MTKWRLVFLLVSILLLGSLTVYAAGETVVEVEGEAVVSNGNLPRAKEVAISDALRNAVEQVVGTLVDSQTHVKNFQLLEDKIYMKSTGYVTKYDVLDAWVSQGVYHVKINAWVKKDLVMKDVDALQLTIQRAGDPRILVIIPETHITREIPDPAAETEIIRQMVEVGFRLVDPATVKAARESSAFRRALSGDNSGYTTLGAQFNADILVIGEAFSELVSRNGGFFSCRARVEVRVVRADTGEILAAHGIHATGADITEATASKKSLAEAGKLMAQYLLSAVPRQLLDTERTVTMTISGLSFTDVRAVEKNLKSTHLVTSVVVRDFVGGVAELEVRTSLLPMELADTIAEWTSPVLEIIGLSGGKIELRKN